MLLCAAPTGTRTFEADIGYELHDLQMQKDGPRLSRTLVFDDYPDTGPHKPGNLSSCTGDACCGTWSLSCVAMDGDTMDMQWERVRDDKISYAAAPNPYEGQKAYPLQAAGITPLGLCCVCICIGLLLLSAILFKLGVAAEGAAAAGTLSREVGFL